MRDKERVLLWLVNRLYANCLYARENLTKWRDIQPGIFSNDNPLQVGDLVTTQTTFKVNDFIVGYVEELQKDCVVIREIGSKRLCNYYNESFMRIDKSILGYEILEGTQYLTYQKVLKAFSNSAHSYSYRFKSISFDKDICKVEARKCFSNDAVFDIQFKYNSKTSIKSITTLIEEQQNIDRAKCDKDTRTPQNDEVRE